MAFCDAGVVDQHADVLGGGSGPRDELCVCHVQAQGDDSAIGNLDRVGVGGVDLCHAALEKLFDVVATHAPARAGNKDGLVGSLGHDDLRHLDRRYIDRYIPECRPLGVLLATGALRCGHGDGHTCGEDRSSRAAHRDRSAAFLPPRESAL